MHFAVAQSGKPPGGHPDYRAISIEAVDKNSTEGKRSSSSLLKMVRIGQRSASLEAKTAGSIKLNDQEPLWSGFRDASSYNGSETALWQDTDSSTAIIKTSLSSANVKVQIVEIDKRLTRINDKPVKGSFSQIVERLGSSEEITITPYIGVDSGLMFEQWNVDLYNDPDIGYAKKVDGVADISAGLR